MIGKILKNYTSLTLIRVISRVLDYLLMIYLIREVISAEILGNIVGLQLILSLSLNIAKQCFKPSYLRQNTKTEQNNKHENILSAMNLMTIGILTTIISAALICGFQWSRHNQLKYLDVAIILYGLSAVLDAIKQKYTVEMTLEYQYVKIAVIQLVSYLPKTFLFFFAAKTGMFEAFGILLFGVGKILFYGMCCIITYSLSKYKSYVFLNKISSADPKQSVYIDPKTKTIVKQLSLITFVKMFLQEFEKIIFVVNHSVEVASVYSLISHIGSIVVRYLFAPLEEIAFNFYSRGNEQESIKALLQLVKGLLYFSVTCIAFGFRYSTNVLQIVYKQKWVNEESIRAFDAYLLLLSVMGINGAMQAFVLAKADHINTIPKFKYFTIFSSLCYFGSSLLFLHFGFGASSIFLGNSIGMMIRIIISWNIQVKKHISLAQFLKNVLPTFLYLLTVSICIYSSYKIKQNLALSTWYDFFVGVILFGVSVIPILIEYRNEILKVVGKVLKKQQKEDIRKKD